MALTDVPRPPADATLERSLGAAWPAYRTLVEGQAGLRPEWKYYGQKYGWSLKLFAGKRNLCFVGPRDGEFMVAFIFGERDVPRVLAADIPQVLKDEFGATRPYAEGRGLRVSVRDISELTTVLALLDIKRNPTKAPKRGGDKA